MLINSANPSTVADAVEQYEALVAVERVTATKTNKTRNALLQSLAPADLLAVSLELKRRGLLNGGSR
jgi:hypothetical protein